VLLDQGGDKARFDLLGKYVEEVCIECRRWTKCEGEQDAWECCHQWPDERHKIEQTSDQPEHEGHGHTYQQQAHRRVGDGGADLHFARRADGSAAVTVMRVEGRLDIVTEDEVTPAQS
jgi:hypothetical protein